MNGADKDLQLLYRFLLSSQGGDKPARCIFLPVVDNDCSAVVKPESHLTSGVDAFHCHP